MKIEYPAKLDEDFDYFTEDPPDLVERLHRHRAQRPAAWVRGWGQPALLLTSYELIDAAFRDEATFPSAAFYGTTVTDVLGRNIQCMEGEEHRINRALVSPGFRQRLMPGLVEPLLEPVAHELIDRFEADGRADLVADFTRRYPAKVILAMLGLPQGSEDDVTRWALGMLDIQRSHEHAVACSKEFEAFVLPILHDDRLVGRMDLQMDRKRNRLVVNKLYAEDHAPADAGPGIGDATRDLAEFLGAEKVSWPRSRSRPEVWRGAVI